MTIDELRKACEETVEYYEPRNDVAVVSIARAMLAVLRHEVQPYDKFDRWAAGYYAAIRDIRSNIESALRGEVRE